jgi:hypothetical protein
MDDESKVLLRQLIDAQRQQTELLCKHVLPLWTRIRFSLLALFVLMTLIATGVGFTVLAVRSTKPATATRQPAIVTTWTATPNATVQPTRNASLQVWPAPIPVDDATANEPRFSGSTSR